MEVHKIKNSLDKKKAWRTVAVEWIAFVLRLMEALGWDFSSETSYLEQDYSSLPYPIPL